MHTEMTARGDGQLAPAAGSAVPGALEATPRRDQAVSPAAISSGCTLRGGNTTVRLPVPVAITYGCHWPRVAWHRAAGGIPHDRECWGEAPGPEAGRAWGGGSAVATINRMGMGQGVYLYKYIYKCIHIYTHIRIHAYTHICLCSSVRARVPSWHQPREGQAPPAAVSPAAAGGRGGAGPALPAAAQPVPPPLPAPPALPHSPRGGRPRPRPGLTLTAPLLLRHGGSPALSPWRREPGRARPGPLLPPRLSATGRGEAGPNWGTQPPSLRPGGLVACGLGGLLTYGARERRGKGFGGGLGSAGLQYCTAQGPPPKMSVKPKMWVPGQRPCPGLLPRPRGPRSTPRWGVGCCSHRC